MHDIIIKSNSDDDEVIACSTVVKSAGLKKWTVEDTDEKPSEVKVTDIIPKLNAEGYILKSVIGASMLCMEGDEQDDMPASQFPFLLWHFQKP